MGLIWQDFENISLCVYSEKYVSDLFQIQRIVQITKRNSGWFIIKRKNFTTIKLFQMWKISICVSVYNPRRQTGVHICGKIGRIDAWKKKIPSILSGIHFIWSPNYSPARVLLVYVHGITLDTNNYLFFRYILIIYIYMCAFFVICVFRGICNMYANN